MRIVEDIIKEAEALSVDERVRIIDALLRSLNPPKPDIEKAWAATALNRLSELRTGAIKPIPGEEIVAKLRSRFGP